MNYEAIIAQKEAEIAGLKHELAELKRLIFGAKSERFNPLTLPVNQLSLFGDIPQPPVPEIKETISYERKKPGKPHVGRNEIPSHFPVEETVLEPEGDMTNMVKIGEEITEYVEYKSASLKKIRIVRPKYVKKNTDGPVYIAAVPARALPKSIASVSLVSHLIVRKFVEHMPFYRQIQSIQRDYQWQLPSSTINDWFITVCTLLEPLYQALKQKVLESGYLQVDESPIQVLENDKKGSSHRGYQWVYYSPEKKYVLFSYHTGRDSEGPVKILSEYQGLLQSDGFKVYDKVAKQKSMIIAACLVHVRRGFYKAQNNDKKRADYVMGVFKLIYEIESGLKELSAEDRKLKRLEQIKPLLINLKTWLEEQSVFITPHSPIGKATAYFHNQWDKMMELFTDGRYELDNNLIENKIRPLALGRKNYLFAGSHEAAQRIAMMYSFFGSCAAQNINPSKWLSETLEKINDTKINNLYSLIPGNSEV